MPSDKNEERELICSRCGCPVEQHRITFRGKDAGGPVFSHPDDGDEWPGVRCP